MSDIIHLLPDSVANQIAAGEVIQRPASVVKELVENSIDAGARLVKVLITDAGRTSIQVIDDGKGMSETDARLSFERHATSKIQQAADLFALHTMGFRGEALASIAAVAHVKLKTRTADSEIGSEISLSGSKVETQEPVACPVGSNFEINDLFFNVPARRKFLKSNTTEMNNIITEFERIVLVHPDIAFSLYSNQNELYHLPVESFKQRIIAMAGKKMEQQLLSMNVETSIVKVSGFVGRPQASVKRGAKQFFFVNGRYMRHPYFHKAVMEAYHHLIPVDEQVPYFIYFEVDPSEIDVNIHPTKTEIKFNNESSIWQILLAAVKESLGKFVEMPTIDFDTEGKPDIPVFEKYAAQPVKMPDVHVDKNYNPFNSAPKKDYSRSKVDWESLYGSIKDSHHEKAETHLSSSDSLYGEQNEGSSADCLQIKGRYLLTSVKSGLMIIDQRKAHIRILYDKYMKELEAKSGVSQRVLFPEVVQFTPAEKELMLYLSEELRAMGFDLSDLGNGSYSMNGVPAGTEGLKPAELIHDMIHSALELGNKVKDELRHSLACSLAKSAAIVYGQVLSKEEITALIDGLFSCPNSTYTPDGHPILTILKEEDLEKRFE